MRRLSGCLQSSALLQSGNILRIRVGRSMPMNTTAGHQANHVRWYAAAKPHLRGVKHTPRWEHLVQRPGDALQRPGMSCRAVQLVGAEGLCAVVRSVATAGQAS